MKDREANPLSNDNWKPPSSWNRDPIAEYWADSPHEYYTGPDTSTQLTTLGQLQDIATRQQVGRDQRPSSPSRLVAIDKQHDEDEQSGRRTALAQLSRPFSWANLQWRRVPWGVRLPVVLVLNCMIILTLLFSVKQSWVVHAKIVFIVMCCSSALMIRRGSGGSSAYDAKSPTPVGYFFAHERLHRDKREYSAAQSGGQLRKRRMPRANEKTRRTVTAILLILAIGWIGYSHPGPLLILGLLVVGAAMLSTQEVSRQQAITMLLAVGTAGAAVDYVSWRISVTNWQGWWFAVPLLFAEILGAIHTLGYQGTIWPRRAPVLDAKEDPTQYPIFIMIPTVNEGVTTLRPTIEGCLAARAKYLAQYPNGRVTIVLCNDGRVAQYPRWTEVETLARDMGVRCVTRTIGGGAKAGNIENARQICRITRGCLLVIFDADQVPNPDFLIKTIPPFADSNVGWVQSGQYYGNLDNPVSRWADDQQSLFYNILCPGKAALNSAFICGTNVVIRAAALDEIGGLPQDSVTEDFAASISLHPRWRSIYISDVLATGLGPLDVPSYLKQQGRWALGTLGVFRGHWRDILLPKKNGLNHSQRVQYFLACTHYICGLRDLIYLFGPVLFIVTGTPAVRTAPLSEYLMHFLPYCMLGMAGLWYSIRGVTGLRGVIIGFGSSPALIGSLAAVILGRKKAFALTSKEVPGRRSLRYLVIYVLLLVICIVALAWATQVKGRQETSLFISMMWIIYSLVLLSSFLWLAVIDIRVHRKKAVAITRRQEYSSRLLMKKDGLRPIMNLGLAALLASPALFGARLAMQPVFTGDVTPFHISQLQTNSRYAGVSLPVQLLRSQPPTLERELDTRFSIVGRTQGISDQFDTSWANGLAAQDARPWIVLQFGSFGSDHKPTPSASLPAIFNGVDDSAIKRWAVEIRNFGRPVYLTVLLQADKNWSVSSGVANGGIPEDVPKAWIHIQSIFRAAARPT